MCDCEARRKALREKKWEIIYGLIFAVSVTLMTAGVWFGDIR